MRVGKCNDFSPDIHTYVLVGGSGAAAKGGCPEEKQLGWANVVYRFTCGFILTRFGSGGFILTRIGRGGLLQKKIVKDPRNEKNIDLKSLSKDPGMIFFSNIAKS